MNFNEINKSYIVENNEIERYSLNLAHYFLHKQNFAFINFQEKILENFNHNYYNIVWIYSSPLFNDVNIDTLLDKLIIIKKRLRKQFYLFNQRILVMVTNCNLDLTKITFPKYIDIINVTEKEKLYENDIINTIFPDLIDYPLNIDIPKLFFDINNFNINNVKKISSIFNKKQFLISIIIACVIIGLFYYNAILTSLDKNIVDLTPYLILNSNNIEMKRFYVLITNSLVEKSLIWVIFDIFFIFSLSIRLEKIFGTFRYLLILLPVIIFTNAFNFGLIYDNNSFGFTAIIYAFIGMFTYVVIIFRRFLVHQMKNIILFNLLLLFLIVLLGDLISFITLIGAFLSGFIFAFIIGIPKVNYGRILHRLLSFLFMIVLIILLIFMGIN